MSGLSNAWKRAHNPKVGRYTISSLIGNGGMDEAYQAEDEKLARQNAIRHLPDEFAQDADRPLRPRSLGKYSTYRDRALLSHRSALPSPPLSFDASLRFLYARGTSVTVKPD